MKRIIPLLIACGMIVTSLFPIVALAAQSPEERYETGMAYYNGDGVEQDYEHAFSYFMIAGEVEQYPPALNMLGICCRDGKGTDQDTDQAINYFQHAADLGSSDAGKNLEELQAVLSKGNSIMPVQPVTGFRAVFATETSIWLEWTVNEGASAYELSYKLHSTSKWYTPKSISATNINIHTLQPGESYDFRIKAISGNEESEYTELNNIYTKYMKVSWLRPSEESENSVKLTWSDNANTNKFEITYCLTGQQARTVNVYGTTYTLENLEPGEYEFKIRAVGEGHASDYTSTTYKYKLAKINPVHDFRVGSIGTTSAVLLWEKNKEAAAYELSYKLHSDSKWYTLKSLTSETKIINNLQPGKPYDFRIKAVSESAESEYTVLNNIYTKYMKVSWLRPSEESENSVKLTWADNSSTNIFEITYCMTGQQARTVKVFGTTYTLYNLEPGVYEFKIRATGTGPASDYTSITYKLANKNPVGDEEGKNSEKEVSKDKNAEGYIGTVRGTWGEKVTLNNSYTHSYELDQPIENCKSLTMTFSIHNVTGDPRGKYYLYGRRIHGRWEHLGEFELSSSKDGTTVTQTFTFKESEGVQITAFAVNQHVAEGVGTWSFNSSLSITDVYIYE